MDDDEQLSSTDRAIQACEEMIGEHRRASIRTLSWLFIVASTLLGLLVVFGTAFFRPVMGFPETTAVSTLFSNTVIFALLAIFVIVFSVFMSIYRFHLNEISKAEHFKLGFMRIRIAAFNPKPGYQSEVRKALTDHAFAYETQPSGLFKNKRVESPLPGHPGSDFAAHLLDKMLDKFDLQERKRIK